MAKIDSHMCSKNDFDAWNFTKWPNELATLCPKIGFWCIGKVPKRHQVSRILKKIKSQKGISLVEY